MKTWLNAYATLGLLAAGAALGCQTFASASNGGGPAGVIAYACNDGRASYLLSFDERRDGFGAPGGLAEANEDTKATARREFLEETNCVHESAAMDLRDPSVSGKFTSYWAKVESVPVEKIRRAQCKKAEGRGEATDWRWVSHAALIDALRDSKGADLRLWDGAAKSLKKALESKAWVDPCGS